MAKSVAPRKTIAKPGSKRGAASSGGKRLSLAVAVRCVDERFYVTLEDGRILSAPLTRLLRAATPAQRRNCRVEAFGTSLHWPDADEDIGVHYVLGVPEDELEEFAGFSDELPPE